MSHSAEDLEYMRRALSLAARGAGHVSPNPRVPYMLVLGAKEAEAGNLSVRDRKGETTTMEVDEFIAKVTEEIKTRAYNN